MRNKTAKKKKSRGEKPWYKNGKYIYPIIVAAITALGGVVVAVLQNDSGPGPEPELSTVEGRVTDEQGPVAGAEVKIDGQPAQTDSRGCYVISNVPTGEKIITASAPGHGDFADRLNITTGGDAVRCDISLSLLRYTIQGKVTDEQGVPVAGAEVKIDGQPAQTDAGGCYVISNVPLGETTITASARGLEGDTLRVSIVKDKQVMPDLVLCSPQPPPGPDIKAMATIPQGDKIDFGSEFDIIVMVNNYGEGPAENLHLLGRAIPSGYFRVLHCDHSVSPLAPAGVDIFLGDMYPDASAQVRFILRAPTQEQIGGQEGMNVEFRFSCDYYGADSEKYAGSMRFIAGPDVMWIVPPE